MRRQTKRQILQRSAKKSRSSRDGGKPKCVIHTAEEIEGIRQAAATTAGILETIGALQASRADLMPATRNTTSVDPALALNVVMGHALEGSYRRTLKNSFGFGGQNACLVLGHWSKHGHCDV